MIPARRSSLLLSLSIQTRSPSLSSETEPTSKIKKGSCGRKLNGLVTKGHRWPWRAIIIRTLAYRAQTGVFDWPEWCDEFFPFSFFAAAGAIKSLRRRSLLTDKKRGISDGSALQSGGGKWYSSEMKRGAERDFDFFFLFTPMLLPLLSK